MLEKNTLVLHVETNKLYHQIGFGSVEGSKEAATFLKPIDGGSAELLAVPRSRFIGGKFTHISNVEALPKRSDGSIIHPYAPDGGPLRSIPVEGVIE